MRTMRLLSALVFLSMMRLQVMGSDKFSGSLSDLPREAQARIRTALQRDGVRLPSGVQEAQGGTAPTGGPWSQLVQPVASTDQVGLFFGSSVAVLDNIVVVGQTYGFSFNSTGAALVFVLPKAGGWNNLTQAAVLVPSSAISTYLFASSVSISGNTIVVGSPPLPNCNTCGPGAAYVYVEPAGGWSGQLTETAQLTASDGVNGTALGSSVSISGDTVVAGAPGAGAGAAYVYVKSANGWVSTTETAKLTASDGVSGDQLAASVSISGNNILAGAPMATGTSLQSGAAYVYAEPASGWANMTQTAKLTASDGASFDLFGQSVAISGTNAVAGAPGASGLVTHSGSAYVFVEPSGGWGNATQTAKLNAPDGRSSDSFGSAVAISNTSAVAGAPQRSPGPVNRRGFAWWDRSGGAYVFTESGSGWNQTSVQVLNGSDAHEADLLGSSVAINGDLVVTGAPWLGKYAGAAFVFRRF